METPGPATGSKRNLIYAIYAGTTVRLTVPGYAFIVINRIAIILSFSEMKAEGIIDNQTAGLI